VALIGLRASPSALIESAAARPAPPPQRARNRAASGSGRFASSPQAGGGSCASGGGLLSPSGPGLGGPVKSQRAIAVFFPALAPPPRRSLRSLPVAPPGSLRSVGRGSRLPPGLALLRSPPGPPRGCGFAPGARPALRSGLAPCPWGGGRCCALARFAARQCASHGWVFCSAPLALAGGPGPMLRAAARSPSIAFKARCAKGRSITGPRRPRPADGHRQPQSWFPARLRH
jgi:hypothetical protein